MSNKEYYGIDNLTTTIDPTLSNAIIYYKNYLLVAMIFKKTQSIYKDIEV